MQILLSSHGLGKQALERKPHQLRQPLDVQIARTIGQHPDAVDDRRDQRWSRSACGPSGSRPARRGRCRARRRRLHAGCGRRTAASGTARSTTARSRSPARSRSNRPSQFCSISTSAPEKSFGCRNSTGLPCAPIFGTPSPSTRAPSSISGVARRDDVGHVVADVMDAAVGIALDEFRDRRGLAERLDEFDLGVGQRHEHGDDAVLGQRHRRGNLRPERRAVDFGGLLGVLDRDRHMIEPAQHGTPPPLNVYTVRT